MFDADNLKKAQDWIVNQELKIHIGGKDIGVVATQEHQYTIVKKICASKDFNAEEKAQIREKVFGNDKSDKGVNVQKVCDAAYPDADLKAKIWAEVTDFESKQSV
jgi:hypothetical protein